MAALPYMQLYVAEYLADTQHLTGPQHGAYMLLMMNYWTRGKALPDSDSRLALIGRTEMSEWTDNVRAAVEEFFVVKDGKWSHKRIDRDLAAVNMKCEQAKENRSKRKKEHGSTPVPTPVLTAVVPREEKRREENIKEKQKPSRDKREPDSRHIPFRVAVEAYGAHLRVKLPWDGSEAKQLDLLLKSSPDLTLAEFQSCLNHRARSPGTPHGERPRSWLPNILKYQQGPLNEFGKTGESNGAFGITKDRKHLDGAQQALAVIAEREAGGYYENAGETGGASAGGGGHGRLLGSG